MARGAKGIKRPSLELGGNAPFVVLPDADLDFAASTDLVQTKLFVSGQVCVTANRIFVHADIEAAFVEKVAAKLAAAKVGDGLWTKAWTRVRSFNRKACEEVASLVARAQANGAKIICENRSYEGDPAHDAKGSFFPPTLVTGVRDEMDIAPQRNLRPRHFACSATPQSPKPSSAPTATPFGLAGYRLWRRSLPAAAPSPLHWKSASSASTNGARSKPRSPLAA